ncbi:beta-N-acetylhexosaminidase [Coxiella endosymbiont of Ornithodoros maritimus]|uniref:beta-N-acetylhexosaminidase n=1 Tax=Coxiella endosymbiont of Ornithodoros maritimus TaxID=1656172 RepID=UPI002264CFB9|nr:beta-N-acetylhexosaminidase [Coxiella endosymbiont of Ornithodoros maritimus]
MGFAIIDLEDAALSPQERELLQHPQVAGVILFTRNYENPSQLRSLIQSIKKIRPLFVAVDQEGGRVQRFHQGFTDLPSMRYFGERYRRDPVQTRKQLKNMLKTAIHELKEVGMDVNMTPILDVDQGKNEIIDERSFSGDPRVVEALGSIVIDTLHAHQMPAVAKHFPGHGGVTADSHQALPIDERDPEAILQCDWLPFSGLSSRLDAIMPAHIIYPAFDEKPATFSRYWLQDMLRKRINFQRVIISDDLTMQGAAVIGDYPTRAAQALEAGCDLLTICNSREGVIAILDNLLHYRNSESQQRLQRFPLG